ncbi:hypothetical protein ACFLY6_03515, partial [Candidatus Dependentiae bacterium]
MKSRIIYLILVLSALFIRTSAKADADESDTRKFEFKTEELKGEPNTQVVARLNVPDDETTAKTTCYNREIVNYAKRIFNSEEAVPTISQDSECI